MSALGHKADICSAKHDVCFTSESRHVRAQLGMSAMGQKRTSCSLTGREVTVLGQRT